MNKPAEGFTLIELMIGVVILSIVISIAAPSFSRILAEQRLRQVSSELRMSLTLARSEAVKRNTSVVLLPRSGGWASGWCLESNSAASSCSATPISEYVANTSTGITAAGGISSVKFNAWGRASNCPKFELETTAGSDTCNICVYVESDGRIVSETGTCASSCPSSGSETPWFEACG